MLLLNRKTLKTALFTFVASISFASFNANAELKPGFLNDDFVVDALWADEFSAYRDKAVSCPAMPEPMVTFSSGSIYKDTPCKCEIDPDKYATYLEEVAKLKDYLESLVKLKDYYLTYPGDNDDAVTCIMDNIEKWAASGAMLGAHEDTVGYHKTADLIGVTAEVLNSLRRSNIMNNYDMQIIKDWLTQGSYNVIDYYTYTAGGRTSVNNHRYWDSFSVGRAAVVTQNTELFEWAIEGLQIGLNQVDSAGLLPRELERGSKASKYHVFATLPLLGLAELAIKNRDLMNDGFYPYAYNDRALHRLMDNMTELAYTAYNENIGQYYALRCHEMPMLEIYRNHVSGESASQMDEVIAEQRQACNGFLKNTYLGGNITIMYSTPLY